MSELGDKLRKVRIDKGLSQQDAAALTGIKYKTINDYENGKSRPDVEKLALLCKAYNTSADYFININTELNASQDVLTVLELEHIKKYRTLDEYGKDMVNTVLEKELYRTNQQKAVIYGERPELADMVLELPLYYMPVSAGGGNYLDSTDYEFISVADVSYANKADFAVRISGDSMEPRFSTGDIILVQEQSAIDPGELGIFILNGDSLFKLFGGDRLISLNENYEDRLIGPDDSFYCKGKVLGAVRCVEQRPE